MAVDFTHYDSNSLLSINKSYQRLESLPLDNSEVIDTLDGLKEYAHNYETAYEGQIVYCKEDKNPYILVRYTGDQGYKLDCIPIVNGEITQKLVELEDYSDMVGNDKLIPISNGVLNVGPTGEGLNADLIDGYNVWSGSGADYKALRESGSLDSDTIYLTKNDSGFIAKEQISPGFDTNIYNVATFDEMLGLTNISFGDICIVNNTDIYYFTNRLYFDEVTTSASAKSDWLLVFGYDSIKSYIENLENKIKELKDQITDINERCYIRPEDNEW